jgi:hypothetical protein
MKGFATKMFRPYYDNTVTALIPEIWANESLLLLEEEMVFANLVHRDFEDEVASYGETVHTRKPSEFEATRKGNADPVTTTDVSTTDVDVVLNQWIHVSFVIKDGEQTKAFKDLVAYYLQPAIVANARFMDQCLAAQAVQFLANTAGGLGMLSNSTAHGYLVDARDVMNKNKAYVSGRNLVLGSGSEAAILKTDLFVSAERAGDMARAQREAYLGRKFGFETYMDLNVPGIATSTSTSTTTTASSVKGATTVAITAAVGVGTYVTVAGDMTPLRSTTNTTTLTPTRPIREATSSGAVVTEYFSGGAVDLDVGYDSGWYKAIHIDGMTVAPQVGQIVAFNDGDTATGTVRTPEYVILQVTNTAGNDYDIVLDRPLATDLADGDAVCLGPVGDFNFGFHRNALALVNRPLEPPMSGVGARAATATHNGMSMRVVITYDGLNQGHRVTLDSLFGVAVLDTALGVVLLG